MTGMVVVGAVLMVVALVLVLLLARPTVVEVGRFQRLTAIAVLGMIMIIVALFTTGMALCGAAVLRML